MILKNFKFFVEIFEYDIDSTVYISYTELIITVEGNVENFNGMKLMLFHNNVNLWSVMRRIVAFRAVADAH